VDDFDVDDFAVDDFDGDAAHEREISHVTPRPARHAGGIAWTVAAVSSGSPDPNAPRYFRRCYHWPKRLVTPRRRRGESKASVRCIHLDIARGIVATGARGAAPHRPRWPARRNDWTARAGSAYSPASGAGGKRHR